MSGDTLAAAIKRFDSAIARLRTAADGVSTEPLGDSERAEVVQQIDMAIIALRDALGEGERNAAG